MKNAVTQYSRVVKSVGFWIYFIDYWLTKMLFQNLHFLSFNADAVIGSTSQGCAETGHKVLR